MATYWFTILTCVCVSILTYARACVYILTLVLYPPEESYILITKPDVRAGGSRRATAHLPVHIYIYIYIICFCVILMSCYHNVPFITRRRRHWFLSCVVRHRSPSTPHHCDIWNLLNLRGDAARISSSPIWISTSILPSPFLIKLCTSCCISS